jgi:NAD(P)H-flavin reductase
MPALTEAPATAWPWYETRPWRVEAVRQESADTVTLSLAPPGGVFAFEPGQFNMMYVPGVGEAPISISGDPGDTTRVLHTIRAVGPVTKALCGVEAGQSVDVRGPFGTSWPVRAAEGGDVVIVAGGIGLPPLRPAIYHLLAHRDRYRRVVVLYGARTPDDLLFRGELAEWRSRFDLNVAVTVDSAGRGWRGHVGVVPDLIGRTSFDAATATAFTVGPEIMMRFTVRALLAAGVPDDRIFLSMERGMRCGVGLCGHCQFGPYLVCRDGAVFGYAQVARWLTVREL